MSVSCTVLAWDTEFFGHRIGRVEAHRLSETDVPAVIGWAERERVDCLYLLADADHAPTHHVAERAGFQHMGIRVELDLRLDRAPAARAVDAVALRPVRPEDRTALLAIARVNHEDTRFYADPRFTTERASALYARWVERSCYESYSGVAFVADVDGGAVGYITASLAGTNGVIDLLGVADSQRGRGLGGQLIARALAWFREQGATTASVVTQGRNIAAQRLYQQAGFRTSKVNLWYHRWSTPQ